MFVNRLMRPLALAAMAMMLMLSVAMTAQAAPITLTDIAGRQVTPGRHAQKDRPG